MQEPRGACCLLVPVPCPGHECGHSTMEPISSCQILHSVYSLPHMYHTRTIGYRGSVISYAVLVLSRGLAAEAMR